MPGYLLTAYLFVQVTFLSGYLLTGYLFGCLTLWHLTSMTCGLYQSNLHTYLHILAVPLLPSKVNCLLLHTLEVIWDHDLHLMLFETIQGCDLNLLPFEAIQGRQLNLRSLEDANLIWGHLRPFKSSISILMSFSRPFEAAISILGH